MSLAKKHCEPCAEETKAFKRAEAKKFLAKTPHWKMNTSAKLIYREFITKNFSAAVHFIDKVAKIAEEENHHPDIHLTGYRKLKIDLSTHAVGGLSENDFILAAKINQLPIELKK